MFHFSKKGRNSIIGLIFLCGCGDRTGGCGGCLRGLWGPGPPSHNTAQHPSVLVPEFPCSVVPKSFGGEGSRAPEDVVPMRLGFMH